jgi:GT2 family glycosyltransferase
VLVRNFFLGISKFNMDLSIIIVSYNTKKLLEDCLKSIYDGYKDTGGYKMETFVVDNGSNYNVKSQISNLKKKYKKLNIILIENKENLGFAKANNLGAKNSKGKFIFFLNPDTKVCPGSLEKVVKFLETHPSVGIVGPQLLNEDGSFQPSTGLFPSLPSLIIEKPIDFLEKVFKENAHSFLGYFAVKWRKFKEPTRVDWVSGAALMCRREVFEEIHGFDGNFFMYFEEVDFCLRSQKAGWEVYFLPQARIYHLRGKSQPAKSRQKAKIYYQSQDYLFAKHRGKIYSNLIKIIRLPYQILDLRTKIGRYY